MEVDNPTHGVHDGVNLGADIVAIGYQQRVPISVDDSRGKQQARSLTDGPSCIAVIVAAGGVLYRRAIGIARLGPLIATAPVVNVLVIYERSIGRSPNEMAARVSVFD